MADQRGGGITWTDETWNPIRGCQRVNTDCINCYAERLAATRLQRLDSYKAVAVMTPDGPRWTGTVILDHAKLLQPLRWKRPRRIFVNGMSDLFIDHLANDQIDQVVAVMAMTPQHTYQVLTKRPKRMAEYLSFEGRGQYRELLLQQAQRRIFKDGVMYRMGLGVWPLPNVWWGVSMGHQKAVEAFRPDVLRCRDHAAVLWVSAEPLTEAIDLVPYFPRELETSQTSSVFLKGIDWVVGGGESGASARPCPIDAARQLRDQCLQHQVPFHWKQWGEWAPDHYDPSKMIRQGKRAAGRRIDGLLWDQYPAGSSGQ